MKAKATLVTRVALLILLAVLAWRAMNYRSSAEPGVDSSIFMSMGWHADNGRVLYKDVWEQKPPMIFALNAAALAVGGDGVNSVRTMERVFSVVGVAALFAATWLAFGQFWLAWLTGLLLLLHQHNVIEDGNVTEEYGAVFMLVGMALAFASTRLGGRKALAAVFAAGAAFSLAVFCKEPFVLIAVPWFVFLAWPRAGDMRAARNRAGLFLGGAALPAIVFVGYLVAHQAWRAWIDTVAYSLAYIDLPAVPQPHSAWTRLVLNMNDHVQPMIAATIAATLGLVALFRKSRARDFDGAPMVIAASALVSLLATSLGGRYHGHYYLFFLPSFALLCASGIAALASVVASRPRWIAVAATGFALLLIKDRAALAKLVEHATPRAARWEGHWLSSVIRETTSPEDLIWTPWKPIVYVESRRLSPTKWHNVFHDNFIDTPGSTMEEKFAGLRSDLAAHPPKVIFISALDGSGPTRRPAEQFLAKSGVRPWISANYESLMCADNEKYELLRRKEVLPQPTPRTSEALAMQAGLTALYGAGNLAEAIACFRLVLGTSPTHYGATFQLAKTLDFAGNRDAATVEWKKVLRVATAVNDTATLALLRDRLK